MTLDELKLHATPVQFLRAGPKQGPRVAVFDIETFPALSYHFRMFKVNILTEQMVEDISMMSFAVKWLGQPDAFYADMSGAGRHMRHDRKLLKLLHTILSDVDMVVAHNGQRFDLPQISARMAERYFSPLPPIRVIDTLLLNKGVFGFSSQSLKHVSPKFTTDSKSDHALFPGFKLWRECLADNPAAWAECRTYNLTDVTSLEEVYMRVRGWYKGAPNMGPYVKAAEGEVVCRVCGSTNMRNTKKKRRTQVGTYERYVCIDCGAWGRGRYLLGPKEDRAHITVQ